MMSEKLFTHASPTLFNAATPRPQLSSCFLLTMSGDSIEDIYDTLKRCALISKSAGGIGLNVHCIRATGSYIAGTNGTSNGLVPMLRVYNNTARYVDQVIINLWNCKKYNSQIAEIVKLSCAYSMAGNRVVENSQVESLVYRTLERNLYWNCIWISPFF